MSNTWFKFKQFTVSHDKCAMKVGVDGVTLGAWADVAEAKNVLDVGCGSGLISLMIAQRCDAQITAIDIDNQGIIQTTENVDNSPWKERIDVQHISFQEYAHVTSDRFDVIISNPPFFNNSLKNPSESRTTARHTDSLSHQELLACSKKLLNPDGKLCLILPVEEGNACIETGKETGLFCSKIVSIFPNSSKPAKRLLLEFILSETACVERNLTIETDVRNQYTPEYTKLVKDFYLKL